MTLFGKRIPMAFSLVIWAVLWEVIGRSGLVFILTPLSDVVAALIAMLPSGRFHEAAWISFKAFSWGMLIAIALGVPMGFLMGRSETANRLLGMWVNIFASAPLSALVPVLMLLFDLGQTTIIVTVVLFAVWIITLDTYAGVRHVSPSLLDMAHSFGASRFQLHTKVLLLAALPEILAGIRMGVIRAVKGIVIGQLLIAVVGLGQLFETYSRNFLMNEFWALALILFAFALGLSGAVGLLERRVEYYASSRSA